MNFDYLLYLAIILFSTKILGILTKKARMPQVVGALIAGLILGPAALSLVKASDFLAQVAELGVIILMFMAGLETNTTELKRSGKPALLIALFGVLAHLIAGFTLAYVCNMGSPELPTSIFLQRVFLGIILVSTSVSIAVETLKEMGKLSTRAGTAILASALIDDILGIIALTLITSFADSSTNVAMVLLKIVGFFVFAIIASFLFERLFVALTRSDLLHNRRYVILSFVFCLLLAYTAEEYFDIADITGAYMAGLVTSYSPKRTELHRDYDAVSYMVFAPVFFASIGLKVKLDSMDMNIWGFTILLVLVSVLTKVIGCGLGAKLGKYSMREALQIGVGMVARGEVTLIIANKGESIGMLSSDLYAPIVVVVVSTTIITPILLKLAFQKDDIKMQMYTQK
jgi:Kef-type K+ transport system membrane component KefB